MTKGYNCTKFLPSLTRHVLVGLYLETVADPQRGENERERQRESAHESELCG